MRFKHINAIFAVAILIFAICSPAFALTERSGKAANEATVSVVDAEVIYIPLKNRIVFGYGSPSLPDGIVVRLTYADGSTETATIEKRDDGYFANEEKVTGSVRPAVVEYGVLTDALFFNGDLICVEYKYLVIPPIFSIVKNIIENALVFNG